MPLSEPAASGLHAPREEALRLQVGGATGGG